MAVALAKTCDVLWVPFKTDCEELLGRFQQRQSVRYEDFAVVWREMDFSSVFYGMTTNREKRPFSRLVFTTVYDYFLPPYSFQIRVGALYMFYGLYFTQPAWPKEKIWIALKDWICIQQFVSDAVSCQHLDVVYVYMKLVSEKAFYYTAMPNQLMFDAKRRFKNKKINDLFYDWPSRVTQLVNAGTLEEITNVQAHYEQTKQACHVSASVSVTPVDLPAQLERALEFQQWQENNKASKSRRHRQVEMDTSESGPDHVEEFSSPHRKKQLSLRQRTWQNLGKKESDEQKQHHWLLSTKEEDKAALKKCQQKNKFKW